MRRARIPLSTLWALLTFSTPALAEKVADRAGALPASEGLQALSVTVDGFVMVLAGAVGGLLLGIVSTRYIETLLFEVRSADWVRLALPSVTILIAAVLAALPAVIRAVRVDPVSALRAE